MRRSSLGSERHAGLLRWALVVPLVATLGVAGVGCVETNTADMNSPPEFGTRTQEYETRVDEGNDGTIEASDPNALPPGLSMSAPGLLSSSTATQTVEFYARADQDTIFASCEHTLEPGTSKTTCDGVVRGAFTVSKSGFGIFVAAALLVPDSDDRTPAVEARHTGDVTIVCGSEQRSDSVGRSPEFAVPDNELLKMPAVEGETCEVTIDFAGAVETDGLTASLKVIQAVSVTGPIESTPDCTTNEQCPAESPFCGSNGGCTNGEEGSPADIPAVQCATEFATNAAGGQTLCVEGVPGSPCSGDHGCQEGYACVNNQCQGNTACASDADCPVGESTCTEQDFCSPSGEQGDGCILSTKCAKGSICLSNVCTVIRFEGESCAEPATRCDGGLRCDGAFCVPLLPPGSACSADEECLLSPGINVCNQAIGGECAARGQAGFDCARDIECISFAGCNESTGQCF